MFPQAAPLLRLAMNAKENRLCRHPALGKCPAYHAETQTQKQEEQPTW